MSHDDYDDGLVHSHGWASNAAPTTFATARERSAMVDRAMAAHPEEADCFDDGLVHSHGWACGERGRMARG